MSKAQLGNIFITVHIIININTRMNINVKANFNISIIMNFHIDTNIDINMDTNTNKVTRISTPVVLVIWNACVSGTVRCALASGWAAGFR